MGEVIAVLSGKGGTGKTAFVAGVSAALAAAGKRVLCIDGDVGLRNLDIFLGMADTEALSFVDVSSGRYPLSAAAVHPSYPSLQFLTAPTNTAPEDISKEDLSRLLLQARKEFDFIFLDGPAGMGPDMRLCARCADRCIITTLPDPASIRCAGRLAQELELLGVIRMRLVVNRIFNDMLKTLGMNIDDIMDAVGLPLMGVVPSDPNVSYAAAVGKPILKYSRLGASAAYKRIAKRILGQPVPVANR